MALAISTLYYITTGIQYWITDYIQLVLGAPADETFQYYSFTCLTAPFLGLITGGLVLSKIGGYSSPNAFPLMFLVGFISVITSITAPFVDSKALVYTFLWLLLGTGAFLLPTMTGIMLNSVSETRRTTANSLATLLYNCFGYFPAPFVYGFVSSIGNDIIKSSRAGLCCIMFASLATFTLLFLGYREQLKKNKEKN